MDIKEEIFRKSVYDYKGFLEKVWHEDRTYVLTGDLTLPFCMHDGCKVMETGNGDKLYMKVSTSLSELISRSSKVGFDILEYLRSLFSEYNVNRVMYVVEGKDVEFFVLAKKEKGEEEEKEKKEEKRNVTVPDKVMDAAINTYYGMYLTVVKKCLEFVESESINASIVTCFGDVKGNDFKIEPYTVKEIEMRGDKRIFHVPNASVVNFGTDKGLLYVIKQVFESGKVSVMHFENEKYECFEFTSID